jgi:hypothetical protein
MIIQDPGRALGHVAREVRVISHMEASVYAIEEIAVRG